MKSPDLELIAEAFQKIHAGLEKAKARRRQTDALLDWAFAIITIGKKQDVHGSTIWNEAVDDWLAAYKAVAGSPAVAELLRDGVAGPTTWEAAK